MINILQNVFQVLFRKVFEFGRNYDQCRHILYVMGVLAFEGLEGYDKYFTKRLPGFVQKSI